MRGTITKVSDRGFAFVREDSTRQDYFVHASALQGVEFDSLEKDLQVTFDLDTSSDRPRAKNVTLAR